MHFAAGEDETGATVEADYGYDPAGNRLTLARANGITTTYSYDTLNRLTNLVNATASTGAVVSSYGYQLNPNGQRHSLTDQTGAVTTYLYDLDSRLYDENGPYTGHIQYQYDNVGNRQYKWVNAAQTEAFVYDADDRVVTEQLGVNTPVTFTYDANGNVLTDATNQYTWYGENKLTSSGPIGGSPTSSDYVYDADGLRVQQTTPAGTTNYTIDPDSGFGDTIEDRDTSGNLQARYDYGQGDLIDMQRSAGTSWYLFDGHGSTMQLTSTAGAVTDSYEYDAYGDLLTRTGTTPNVYLYDAQCADSTGLYYLRARYMDPARGEFLGQDTYSGDRTDPITLHKYAYAADDPSDRSDRTGLDFGDVDMGIGGLPGLGFVATTITAFFARFESTYIDSWTSAQYASEYSYPDITARLEQTADWIRRTYTNILATNPSLALRMSNYLYNWYTSSDAWDVHQLSSSGAGDPTVPPSLVGNSWIDGATNPRLSSTDMGGDLRMVDVQGLIGEETFHSYSVNYLAFGIMNQLTNHPQWIMDGAITGRKALEYSGKDVTAATAWADAGYNGWPDGAFTPFSNIQSAPGPSCCAVPPFSVIWEPYSWEPDGVQASP